MVCLSKLGIFHKIAGKAATARVESTKSIRLQG
jgi:hypothetical protein